MPNKNEQTKHHETEIGEVDQLDASSLQNAQLPQSDEKFHPHPTSTFFPQERSVPLRTALEHVLE